MVKRAIHTNSWTITVILSTAFLAAIDELQLKRMCNTQKLRIAKSVFKKNNKVVGLTLYSFKPCYSVTITEAVVLA